MVVPLYLYSSMLKFRKSMLFRTATVQPCSLHRLAHIEDESIRDEFRDLALAYEQITPVQCPTASSAYYLHNHQTLFG